VSILERRNELNPDRLKFIYSGVNKRVQPGESMRFEFAYQAGRWFGYRPKPDTHTFSCKVDFVEVSDSDCKSNTSISTNNLTLQQSASIDISIFPSLTGMILGTLLGSFLGTLVRADFNLFDPHKLWINLQFLFVNMIFGFIAGIILMRRKDVQSFITIEDLWGGILIGFIVGYSGRTIVERLINLNSIIGNATGSNSTINSTS
jgi:hypothetical protein